ncbi:MAG: hypothetical protein ABJA60_09325, partial [Nitrosospira sp.]
IISPAQPQCIAGLAAYTDGHDQITEKKIRHIRGASSGTSAQTGVFALVGYRHSYCTGIGSLLGHV